MARSASSPATRDAAQALTRARARAPTGSPIASPVGVISSVAPIAASTSSAPARVGLRPTFSTVTSLPATVAAATNRNVADDRSPGISDRDGAQPPVPAVGIDDDGAARRRRRRSARPGTATCARCDRAIGPARAARSRPSACSPASTSALLSCALATGQVVRDAGQRAAAHAQGREDVAGRARIDAPVDGRAHPAQRLGHAPHRPPRQRGVADQLGLERAARERGPSAGGSSCPSCRSRARRPRRGRPAKPTPWTRGLVAGERDRRRRARAAPPPSTGCRRPGPGRAPRRRRPRARRTAARGARSTCRRERGRRRAAGRNGGPSASVSSALVATARLTITVARALPRASRSSCSTASSLSASPSRLSAAMCRWTWTRDPSAASVRPSNTGARPSSAHHLLRRVDPRARRVQIEAAARRVAAAVEQRQRVEIEIRRRGPAARRRAAGRREPRAPPRRAPACPSVTRDRQRHRGRTLVGVERRAAARPAGRRARPERCPRPRRSAARTARPSPCASVRGRDSATARPCPSHSGLPPPAASRAAPGVARENGAADALGVEAAARDGERRRRAGGLGRRRPASARPR